MFSAFFNRTNEHLKEVLHGASVALLLRVVGALLSFGLNVAIARVLGPEQAGIYFLALTIVVMASVLSRMGLDNAMLRMVAAGADQKNWGVVQTVYRHGMRAASIASVLILIALALAADLLSVQVFDKPLLATPLRVMALAILPVSLVYLNSESLRGLKRIRDSQLLLNVAIPGLTLPLLLIMGPVWQGFGAALAYTVATSVVALAGLMLWRKVCPPITEAVGAKEEKETKRTLFGAAPSLFGISLLSLIMTSAATLALGVWASSEDVAVFSIADRLAMLTGFTLLAVNAISAPKFAALHHRGDRDALNALARSSTQLMAVTATPVLLLLLLFPEWILGFFGPSFTTGSTLLRVLMIGQLVSVLTGSVGYLLMMTGHEAGLRNLLFVSTGLCIVSLIIFVPLWGAMGAALSVTLTTTFRALVSVVVLERATGIKSFLSFSQPDNPPNAPGK